MPLSAIHCDEVGFGNPDTIKHDMNDQPCAALLTAVVWGKQASECQSWHEEVNQELWIMQENGCDDMRK